MIPTTLIRGPILNPRGDGRVAYFDDGALGGDESGRIVFCGAWAELAGQLGPDSLSARRSAGIMTPPFLDAHIHIPQHPIRGHFMEGVPDAPCEGRLLWGLNHNVFPTERRCVDESYTRSVVHGFLQDTLSNGVVGGAAYMTVHAHAARIALEELPSTWQVGLVLMNQNCPQYLRTDEAALERDIADLAGCFGQRLIVTDRFAVSVDSSLRRRAAGLANQHQLRMQTHLNEQLSEKRFVEGTLYPEASSYTDVYARDGLLDRDAILAHCIHMSDVEFETIAERGCSVAHCPVSNSLLGSGIMPLKKVLDRRIPIALCTDVGASPTTSLLTEMSQFLKVHADQTDRASAELALNCITRAPAQILGLDDQLGALDAGMPMSFIEIDSAAAKSVDAERAIRDGLLGRIDLSAPNLSDALRELETGNLQAGKMMSQLINDVERSADQLQGRVNRVTLKGQVVWERAGTDQAF